MSDLHNVIKNANLEIKPDSFHAERDVKPWHRDYSPGGLAEPIGIKNVGTKGFIIQEHDVSYRFYLHQHPYVQRLVQELLLKGVSELQAADTAHKPDRAYLPGSLEIALYKDVNLTILADSRISMLTEVKVGLETGDSTDHFIELKAKEEVDIIGTALVTLPAGLRAILVDGMDRTPSIDTYFWLDAESEAVIFDAEITLTEDTKILLPNGKQGRIPKGTKVLLTGGTQLMLRRGTEATFLNSKPRPELFEEFFDATYQPNTASVQWPYPVKDLDFSSSGAYSVYNWELFFHVPLTIAIHLSKNQHFAEAQRWFHYIFDPTDDSDGPTPERFWKVRPFQSTDVKKREEIFINLVTGADETLREDTVRNIEAWRKAPFRPHIIARHQPQAYMYKTVMAYLDNLIAWGDSLFRQDAGEAIDEAMMLYVLAANILGPRPQPVPKKGTVRQQTYANLRSDLKQFGAVLRDIEADLPFDLMPFPADDAGSNDRLSTLRSLGQTLYFCMPRNDKLLSYWDTVADRLFKIRSHQFRPE